MNVDSWTAHRHRDLAQIVAACLDLIDCGPDQPAPRPRRPSRAEKDATWIAGDHYVSTPSASTRAPLHESKPTEAAVLAWETQAQQATTRIAALVSGLLAIGGTAPVVSLDEHGDVLEVPPDPPVREIRSGPKAGQVQVDCAPPACRRHVLVCASWAAGWVDGLGRLAEAGWGDVGATRDRMRQVEQTLKATLRAVGGPPAGDGVCRACGRRPVKYRGLGRCDACRRRELRHEGAA